MKRHNYAGLILMSCIEDITSILVNQSTAGPFSMCNINYVMSFGACLIIPR